MSLRPYKFQIVAICQEVEGDQVIGEKPVTSPSGQPIEVFGIAGLHAFGDGFEEQLSAAVKEPTPTRSNRAKRRKT